MDIREQITQEVAGITPLDVVEEAHQKEVLHWIGSGEEIFRIEKPATPYRHIVSYFVVVDGDHMLLVDHIKGQCWLPSGGHVDPGEHPQETVKRECMEELFMPAQFLTEKPLMLTVTKTVGIPPVHEDVSLWYVLKGDRSQEVKYAADEFDGVKWFHFNDVPLDQGDPHMERFLQKLRNFREGQ